MSGRSPSCKRSSASWLAGGLVPVLLWCSASLWAGRVPDDGPWFSAPYSGERVLHYKLSLPVGPHSSQSLSIPEQCPQARHAFTHGAQQWCNRVQRRMWVKVMMDCDYAAFLSRFPKPPAHDFVSAYDFLDADLEDLPLGHACSLQKATGKCLPVPAGVADLGRMLARDDSAAGAAAGQPGSCRISHGRFRGSVRFTTDGLKCYPARKGKGFRILSVDYADVNGDGYMDATLKIIPLGPGARRIPLILPLTRTQPEGPFRIPDDLFSGG